MKNFGRITLLASTLYLPLLNEAKASNISTPIITPLTLDGCLVEIQDNNSQSPEGSGKTCFFKDGRVLLVGWATMVLGNYQINPQKNLLSVKFPKYENKYQVTATYDPTIKGTQFNFQSLESEYFQAENAPIKRILNIGANCVGDTVFTTSQPIKNFHLYYRYLLEDGIFKQLEYHLTDHQNKLFLANIGGIDYSRYDYHTALEVKNNQVLLNDSSESVSNSLSKIVPFEKDDKEIFEIKQFLEQKEKAVIPKDFYVNWLGDGFEIDTKDYNFDKQKNLYKIKSEVLQKLQDSDRLSEEYDYQLELRPATLLEGKISAFDGKVLEKVKENLFTYECGN